MKCFYKVALVALVFFGFIACSDKHSSPEACAEAIMQYIVDGKADKAIEMMRDRDGKPLDDKIEKDLAEHIPIKAVELQKIGKIKSIKANQAIYTNDEKTKATVVVHIEFENGLAESQDINITLINGKWYSH